MEVQDKQPVYCKWSVARLKRQNVNDRPNCRGSFLAATKQLYKWYFPSVFLSVCQSVRPSVRLSQLFQYVPIILSSLNFQELLPMIKVRSMQKTMVRGQRSRSQRSKPNLTVSGLSLQFEFTNGYEIMHKAWSSMEEVPYCISRSSVEFQGHTGQQIADFDPNWAFPDCNFSFNSQMAMKLCTKLETTWKRCPFVIQGHPSNFKITRDKKCPILTRIERFRTVNPIWMHPWLWNDAQSLMFHRRGAPLFFKVIHQISRSQGTKIADFDPNWDVYGL